MAQDPRSSLPPSSNISLVKHRTWAALTQFMAQTRNTRVCLFPVSCFPSGQGDDETQSNTLNCDVIAGYVQRISVWVQFSVNERSTCSISMAGFDQLIDNQCCLFCAFVLLGTPARAGQAEPPLRPPGSLSNQSRTKQSQPGVWSPLGPVSDFSPPPAGGQPPLAPVTPHASSAVFTGCRGQS